MSFSLRKPSPRTLLVVDLATRKVIATRDENMNGGSSCAKITKSIYEAVKGGKAIMYYAHRPDDVRLPVEINGRYYAKPSKWVPKAPKVPAPVNVLLAATPERPIKIFNKTGYNDGTDFVEYDGKSFTSVSKTGSRMSNIMWSANEVHSWILAGKMIPRY